MNKKISKFLGTIKQHIKDEIEKTGADVRLKTATGMSLEDLDNMNLPPMGFDEFCEFIDTKIKEHKRNNKENKE